MRSQEGSRSCVDLLFLQCALVRVVTSIMRVMIEAVEWATTGNDGTAGLSRNGRSARPGERSAVNYRLSTLDYN